LARFHRTADGLLPPPVAAEATLGLWGISPERGGPVLLDGRVFDADLGSASAILMRPE
jgi:hypothetical protein